MVTKEVCKAVFDLGSQRSWVVAVAWDNMPGLSRLAPWGAPDLLPRRVQTMWVPTSPPLMWGLSRVREFPSTSETQSGSRWQQYLGEQKKCFLANVNPCTCDEQQAASIARVTHHTKVSPNSCNYFKLAPILWMIILNWPVRLLPLFPVSPSIYPICRLVVLPFL